MPMPDLPPDARVLELGCGSGKTLGSMPPSWRTVALDISLAALNLSRPAAGGRTSLVRADARSLPFKDESFDAVFAFHVIGHLLRPERLAAAQEVTRILARSGVLFWREFGRSDFRAGKGVNIEPWTFRNAQGTITHYFTEAEAAGLFSDLAAVSLGTKSWVMRVRGRDLPRFEVHGTFFKP